MFLCLGCNAVWCVLYSDVSEEHSDTVFRERKRGVLFNYVIPCQPWMYVCESTMRFWNDTDRSPRRQTCPIATSCTANLTWTGLESNSFLRGKWQRLTDMVWHPCSEHRKMGTSETMITHETMSSWRFFLFTSQSIESFLRHSAIMLAVSINGT
jgi:hypothetical protein